MANTHTTLASLFTAIADKIRKKTGSTDEIVADDFPDVIDSILTPTDGTIATVVQATPSISVSSAGLITASATQTAGYVSAGTKSTTKQLTTQAAKTITPSTSSQTAVASGRYTTGDVAVLGDSNLVSSNIKSGVSIFNVTGNYSGESVIVETGVSTGSINGFFFTLNNNFSDVYSIYLYPTDSNGLVGNTYAENTIASLALYNTNGGTSGYIFRGVICGQYEGASSYDVFYDASTINFAHFEITDANIMQVTVGPTYSDKIYPPSNFGYIVIGK